MTEVSELIKAYEQDVSVKGLAQRFGIHRATVTALLQRHGVELHCPGLAPADIPAAVALYGEGWSCAQLGTKFGVDAVTVWRALRAAQIPMRSPQRRKQVD